MKKIIDWIKEHKFFTAIILAILFTVPLLIVHILFAFPAKSEFFVASWDASGLITYIAGFETLLASLFLGFVALKKDYDINKKQQDMENKNTCRPFFTIEKVAIIENDSEKNIEFIKNCYQVTVSDDTNLVIYLKNIGNGIAVNTSHDANSFGFIPDEWKNSYCIEVGQVLKINVPAKKCYFEKTIRISYSNIVDWKYYQTINISGILNPIVEGVSEVIIDNEIYNDIEVKDFECLLSVKNISCQNN